MVFPDWFGCEAKRCANYVWEGRESGLRAWLPCGDNWVTIVPGSDEFGDFLGVSLAQSVDFQGYPDGIIARFLLDEDDMEDVR